MRCPSCQFENPPGMRFCGQCATLLALRCARCGFDNPPGMRFCGQCGSGLAAQDVRSGPQAERRHLSVMFCDLVGSTELSASLDPEDWREVLHSYQNAAATAIKRFEGYIAQFLGDGLLIYFGYPRAHEDDAVRAVRAGLALLAAMDELPATKLARLPELRLAVRIGVHSGHVVVSEMGEGDTRERLALGHVPNVASRLQNVAEPATLLISEATYQLVRGFVECESAGVRELKGVPKPVPAYRVLGLRSSASRLDIALAEGATPLAGRVEELEHLQARWRQARSGAGRAALVSGEPGIGKSRLVRSLRERLTEEHRTLELACSALYRDSALHPVVELVSRAVGSLSHRDPARQRRRLAALARALGSREAEAPRWLSSLLGLAELPEESLHRWTPLEKKRLTFETLLGLLRAFARRRPLLLVVEDLHWVDPSTLELLTGLVEGISAHSVFLLLTTRPEGTPGWPIGDVVSRLELRRLSTAEMERMIQGLAGEAAVPAETLARLVERADGVPLFVEELARITLDLAASGEGTDGGSAIPERLQDLLAARLDRLGPAKQLAQIGATIGREFASPLLAAVLGRARDELTEDLQRLLGSGLVVRREDGPEESFSFRHALIQETAYGSLLRSERTRCHGQIAEALESGVAAGEPPPELLAHHFTEAGRSEPAIGYWLEAGRRAVGRSANIEATRHLRRGLDLVAGLPESEDRDRRELEMALTLGPALMAVRGFAEREVEKIYRRAITLSDGAARSPRQKFAALWGLVRVYSSQDHLRESCSLGQRLVALAEEAKEPDLELEAHRIVGSAFFQLGQLDLAHRHLEKALALFEAGWTPFEATLYLQPRVFCLFWMGYVLQFLGFPRQADQRCEEALELAESTGEPFGIGAAMTARVVVAAFRRDVEPVLSGSAEVMAFAAERKLALWGEMGTIYHGWALIQTGQKDAGLGEMQRGLVAWRKLGMSLILPQFLCLCGEGHVLAGQVDEALDLLEEALRASEASGERVYLAEILRQKGEVLWAAGLPRSDQAAECFRRAITVASEQRSRVFELRAWVSLGRRSPAAEMAEIVPRLSELLDCVEEGPGDRDRLEGMALLAERSRPDGASVPR